MWTSVYPAEFTTDSQTCTRLGTISQDPIGFAAGDANVYRYVGNDPVGSTDPFGLQEGPSSRSVLRSLFGGSRPNSNPANQSRAGNLAAASGLYSTDRHKRAFEGALHVQDAFAELTPGAGQIYSGVKAVTGYNPITNQPLGIVEIGLAALGVFAFSADDAFRAGRGAIRRQVDEVDELGSGFVSVAPIRGASRAPGSAAGDLMAVNGLARPIPLHDTATPWYKFLSPKYDTDIWVRTAGRTPSEIAGTWSHERQHSRDFTNLPGITHLAARGKYFPGSGAARYFLEFRGYRAGGTFNSLRTPLQSFNAQQTRWLGYDALIFGVGGIGAVYSIYDWWTDE